MYVNDLCVINENTKSRRHFPLIQQYLFVSSRQEDKILIASVTQQRVSHFWDLLDNCFKDPTALNGNRSAVAQTVIIVF